MTSDEYEALVEEIDREWGGRPRRLRARASVLGLAGLVLLAAPLLLAVFGFVVSIGLVLVVPGLLPPLVAVMAGLAVLGLGWLMVEGFRSCEAGDGGMRIDPEAAPRLFSEIRDLAGSEWAGEVSLTGEMNAGMVKGAGLAGGLRIGLPLMDVLPADEFRAVLAHELAHHSGRLGWVGGWVTGLKSRLERLFEATESGTPKRLLGRVFGWFWPYFKAHAVVVGRMRELGADEIAAEQVSAQALAGAMLRLAVERQRLEGFWAGFQNFELMSPVPPEDVHQRLRKRLSRSWDEENCRGRLMKELRRGQVPGGEHPPLAKRLAALGVAVDPGGPELPAPVGTNATAAFLPELLADRVRVELSRKWRAEMASAGARCRRAAESGPHHAWERITALVRLDGLSRMQPEILSLLEKEPHHSGALYLRGCHLAGMKDVDAESCFERAAEDPALGAQVFEAWIDFHQKAGRPDEAEKLRRRAREHDQGMRRALVERCLLGDGDVFLPLELSDRAAGELGALLQGEAVVKKAWLAAKKVVHFPVWPNPVLLLETGWPPQMIVHERDRRGLRERIQKACWLDGYVVVVERRDLEPLVAKAIQGACPDGPLFRRKQTFFRF